MTAPGRITGSTTGTSAPDPGRPALGGSWLFVPGDRPDRFEAAAASGAHHVIVDLEDAVPAGAKDEARDATTDWLRRGGTAWVRVGAMEDSTHADDLAALAAVATLDGPGDAARGLRGVVLPKATPASVAATAAALGEGRALLALVETAAGIRDVHKVASGPGVAGLALGTVDLAVDLGVEPGVDHTWDALLHARSTLVVAARANGLPGPIDGPDTAVREPQRAGEEAAAVRALGFRGKLCIHPAQVPAVNAAFAPTDTEVDWARRIASVVGGPEALVAAHDGDLALAVQVDGEMVDRPVLLRARRVLVAAAAAHASSPSSPSVRGSDDE